MRAALFGGERSISVGERPDPAIELPTDAVVRVMLACVCGSDLWYYRGSPHSLGAIGHEFLGVMEEVGSEVSSVRVGDLVVAPFTYSDGTCPNCATGWTGNCVSGGPLAAAGSTAARVKQCGFRWPTAPWSRFPVPDIPSRCSGHC